MKRPSIGVVSICIALTVGACAPVATGSSSLSPVGAREVGRALKIMTTYEPDEIKIGSPDKAWIQVVLFTANLGSWDAAGNPYGVLSETIPELNTDTWRVFSDGRMETTYRLRAGLTWHDGIPLTSEDFVFGYRVQQAEESAGTKSVSVGSQAIEKINSPDPQTVVIQWRELFAEAAAPPCVGSGGCIARPMPRHILEARLDGGDPNAFFALPYWTTEFVGAGPFRLDRWERGAFIDGSAFDGYALGRPKISKVHLTWNSDPSVAVTRLLASDADAAVDGSLRFDQVRTLQDWAQSGNSILLSPLSLRYAQAQSRRDWANPQVLLDPRVREALLRSVDRPALAEAMVGEASMVADTIPPPVVGYQSSLDQVVKRYPYDPQRAEQLMSQVGYTRGADGVYTSPTDGRLQLEIQGTTGAADEQDSAIVRDYLRRTGLEISLVLIPESARDNKTKGAFPGLQMNHQTLDRKLGLDKYYSRNVGVPENNWVGGNRSGWSNPEFDRLFNQWARALDPTDRTRYILDMMRLISTEIAMLPFYYNFQVQAYTGALSGPQSHTPDGTRYGDVHQWAWR